MIKSFSRPKVEAVKSLSFGRKLMQSYKTKDIVIKITIILKKLLLLLQIMIKFVKSKTKNCNL